MVRVMVVAVLSVTPSSEARPVSWLDVRADIAETICVQVKKLPDGKEALGFVAGSRSACTGAEARRPLSRAVDKALGEARSLLISVAPEDIPFKARDGVPAAEGMRAMREAYLASKDFLRPILSRLAAALTADGLACADCPAAEVLPFRRVSWDDFAPYLAAHVWPDPVATPIGPDGRPAGMPQYSFHICTGINGISKMKDPDQLLVRAGYIAAMETEEVRRKAGRYFDSVLNDEGFRRLADDDARTQYLQGHLGAAVAKDPAVRKEVCTTLGRYAGDLGLEIENCQPATTARP